MENSIAMTDMVRRCCFFLHLWWKDAVEKCSAAKCGDVRFFYISVSSSVSITIIEVCVCVILSSRSLTTSFFPLPLSCCCLARAHLNASHAWHHGGLSSLLLTYENE